MHRLEIGRKCDEHFICNVALSLGFLFGVKMLNIINKPMRSQVNKIRIEKWRNNCPKIEDKKI